MRRHFCTIPEQQAFNQPNDTRLLKYLNRAQDIYHTGKDINNAIGYITLPLQGLLELTKSHGGSCCHHHGRPFVYRQPRARALGGVYRCRYAPEHRRPNAVLYAPLP